MRDPNPMARIAASLGPSRWHPFKRRAWARLMADTDGAHWSHHAEAEQAWLTENVFPVVEAMVKGMSVELPEGYSLVWDTRPLGTVDT